MASHKPIGDARMTVYDCVVNVVVKSPRDTLDY